MNYLSHSGKDLYIQMDIGFVYGGEGIDDEIVPDSVFKNYTYNSHTVTVESIQPLQLSESKSYSNLILLDISGDWNYYDSFNAKTRALHKSILDGKANSLNEIALGSFAREGYYQNEQSIWVFEDGNPFTQTREELGKILFDKYWEYQGTSNVYNAINIMIDNHVYFSQHQNKNITVITHELPDGLDTVSVNQIIAKAIANDITINVMIVADNDDGQLAKLALQTGGFVQIISSTNYKNLLLLDVVDQAAPIMACLDRILSKNVFVHRVILKLRKTLGNWQPGTNIYNYYQTVERYTDSTFKVNNYIPYYVTVP